MKQLILKIGLLAAIVLSLAGCGSTKTGLYPLFCYVEYEGEETTYSVKYVDEINFKHAEYETRESSDKCFYFYNVIETFTSGNSDSLDKVEYSLSRIKGTARCTLYVANYSKGGKYNPLDVLPDKDFEMTDQVKAWLHENYIAKCILEPEMRKVSVNVLLE